MRGHLKALRELFTRPWLFLGEAFLEPDLRKGSRFAMRNGVLLAAGLSIVEAVREAAFSWTLAAVTLVLFLALPPAFLGASALWALLVRSAGSLLSESVPFRTAFLASAYSTAGLLPLVFDAPLAWLALGAIPLQVIGMERGMSCSRVRSSVFVLFPFSLVALFLLFFTFLFEVF